MAKDRDGRPIPAYVPEPPPSGPQPGPPTAMQEQMVITQQKTDDALRTVADHGQRISMLEQTGGDQLNAALLEFDRRFTELMENNLREMEKRYEALAETVAAMSIRPQEPEPPVPTPRSHTHR